MKVKRVDMRANISGIYSLEINGRFYIGSSVNIYERLSIHLAHLRNDKHHSIFMQRSFNKHGENSLKFNVIEKLDRNIPLLRERELHYIDDINPEFNSTTPITYVSTQRVRNKISNTMKQQYSRGERVNPRTIIASKYDVYDFRGEIYKTNLSVNDILKVLNITNRSSINIKIRSGKFLFGENRNYLIIPSESDLDIVYNIVPTKPEYLPIYKIYEDGSIEKCTTAAKYRIKDKVINSKYYMYYSKKNKCYYTFIGNFDKCRFYKKL